MKILHAVAFAQGKRSAMEDAHCICPRILGDSTAFCGVFDGHCGTEAAQFAAKCLPVEFIWHLAVERSVRKGFVSCYEAVSSALDSQDSGACAATAFIVGNVFFYAHAGDSRIMRVRQDSFSVLTRDHRINSDEECTRVVRAGAFINFPYVCKGERGLMVTRSLGDRYFKDIGVIATPQTGHRFIRSGDLFLIACDGLFDSVTVWNIAEIARSTNFEQVAERLVNTALVRGSRDNITVLALQIA